MKWLRVRFSLRTLLVCATLVALFFGAAQIHRRRMIRQIEEWRAAGLNAPLEGSWVDQVWARVPKQAGIPIKLLRTEECEFGPNQTKVGVDEAVARAGRLRHEAEQFGIERVSIFFIRTSDKGDYVVSYGGPMDGLKEALARGMDK